MRKYRIAFFTVFVAVLIFKRVNDHFHSSSYLPSAITETSSKSLESALSANVLSLMLSKMKEKTPVVPMPVAPRHNVSIDGFNDLLLPRVCGRSKPHFIVFVSSTPGKFVQRKALRETWANTSAYPPNFLEVMFVVGHAPNEDDVLRRRLLSEWQTHGDLLYTDFIDTYGNVTYKTLAAFRFVVEHCAGTPYVIKSDDDTVVNIPALHAHMLRYRPGDMPLDCYLHTKDWPIRKKKSKWFVSYEEVPLQDPDIYPYFCSGGAVFTTYVTIKAMYSQVAQVPWLRLDDVYTTGYLAQKIQPPVQFHNVTFGFGEKSALEMLKRPVLPLLLFVLQVRDLRAVWGVIAKQNLKKRIYLLLKSHTSLDFWNTKLFYQE